MTGALLTALLTTCILSLSLTPAVQWLAQRAGAVDTPNSRKIHSAPIPRLGGIALVISLFTALIFCHLFFPRIFALLASDAETAFMNPFQGVLIVCSLLSVFFIGIWDDIKSLGPVPKLFVQFLAASLLYFGGFQITVITNPAGPGFLPLYFLSYPLTVIWIVGITNAFNLIDGLDGLASGVAIIALITLAAISFFNDQAGVALAAVLLAGSVLGFLWFNFRPATIFLGDSGSLFLGFALALLSIQSFTKVSTTFAVLVPIFALGLPITDTILSIIRRFFSSFLQKNGSREKASLKKAIRLIFLPDRFHIHHQLINRGLSHRNTVLVLYAVSIFFGIGAFIVAISGHLDTTIFIVLLLAFAVKAGISRLKYNEIDVFHNGLFFRVYNSLLINKRHLRKFLDSLFILIAYAGSYYLLNPGQFMSFLTRGYEMVFFISVIYFIQISTFWLTGLYRETIRHLGIADLFKLLKTVTGAVLLTFAAHHLFLTDILPASPLQYVLDFYFLGTLILGVRASFHLLKYLFNKSRQTNTRVLIYGTGEQGLLALQRLLSNDSHHFTLVGFIDEDPQMEGRWINGFLVFGGHWKLERLIRTRNIHEIHITESNLPSEVIRRVYNIAEKYGLAIRLLQIQLKNLSVNSSNDKTEDKLRFAN